MFTPKTEVVAEKGYLQLTISELWELSTSSADVDLAPSPLLCGFRLRIGVVGQPANICKIAHLTQNFVSTLIIDIIALFNIVHSIRIIHSLVQVLLPPHRLMWLPSSI